MKKFLVKVLSWKSVSQFSSPEESWWNAEIANTVWNCDCRSCQCRVESLRLRGLPLPSAQEIFPE